MSTSLLPVQETLFPLDTPKAVDSRFFNYNQLDISIDPNVAALLGDINDIAADAAAAKEELATYSKEDLEEHDKVMRKDSSMTSNEVLKKAAAIENLLERNFRYEDNASLLLKEGRSIVETIMEHYSPGFRVINKHPYWMRDHWGQQWFCSADEDGSIIYFNRDAQFEEKQSRAATLSDYITLMSDIAAETATTTE